MQIGKRDIEKMIGYHSHGSKPEVLARTVKDLGKAKSRAVIASAMGWTGCSKAFINRCRELGASDAEIAEVERMCDTYELPEPFKSQFEANPNLSEVSQLREWFPKLFKVLRDYKVQNIKLDNRNPNSKETELDNTNNKCYTVAYTVSFDLNGKHYEWKIANHTNDNGGSFGVSAQAPLNINQGTHQSLANRASEILGGDMEESKTLEARAVLNQILSGKSVRQVITESVLKTSKLNETRKFKVGEKFTFTDKYGSTHECTVLKKDLFDDMDYDDYAIGTMTFSYPTLGSPHKETVRIFKSEQRDSYGDEYFVSDVSKTKSGVGIASWAFPNRAVTENSVHCRDSEIDVKSARLLTVDDLKKAANEARGGDKYISVDAIKTSPVVGNFFADSSLVNDFYKFMVEWNNDNEDYYKQHYNNLEYEPLKFSVGKAYIKVVRRGAVDAFIDKFGNVYKPAGWNAPAKGVRYYITDYKRIPFDPHGSFLYGNKNLVPLSAESFASENEVEEAMDMFGMDDSFFNKEELLEFASDAVDKVNADFKSEGLPFSVDYTGVWMEDDDRTVTVDFVCFPNEIEYSASVKIDMRAIKSPNDLFKYTAKMADEIKAVVEKEVE